MERVRPTKNGGASIYDSLAPGEFFRLSERETFMFVPGKKIAPVLAIAFLGVIAIVAAFRLDDWALDRAREFRGDHWKDSVAFRHSSATSKYGDWPELMALGAAGLLAAWLARSREWKRILIAAMVASTLAGIIANTSRLTTGRTRPRESPKIERGWYGPIRDGRLTIGDSKYNSFPSGHTATAVGFAGVIFFARPLLGVPALILAFAIGASRILLGAHFLSDVTVAAILALAMAWLCWRVAVRRGDAIAAWVAQKIRRRP